MDDVVSQSQKPEFEASQDSPQIDTQQQTTEASPQQPLEPTHPSKKKKWLLPVLVVILVLALGVGGYFVYQNYQLKQQVAQVQPIPPTPVQESLTKNEKAGENIYANADLDNIPSLYPSLSWQTVPATASGVLVEEPIALTVNKGNKYFNIALKGQRWTSEIKDIENSQKVYDLIGDFSSYYGSQLTALGWNWRITISGYEITVLAADGPTGGVQGYIGHKDGMTRTILWSNNTHYKKGEFPTNPSCPCDTTLSVFVSEITPLSEILPESDLDK